MVQGDTPPIVFSGEGGRDRWTQKQRGFLVRIFGQNLVHSVALDPGRRLLALGLFGTQMGGPAGVWRHPHQDIGLPRRSAHARRPSLRNWHPVRRFVALLHHVHHFFGLERPTLSQGFKKGPPKKNIWKRQACFSFEQECAETPHAEHFLEYSSGSSICKDAQSSSRSGAESPP